MNYKIDEIEGIGPVYTEKTLGRGNHDDGATAGKVCKRRGAKTPLRKNPI